MKVLGTITLQYIHSTVLQQQGNLGPLSPVLDKITDSYLQLTLSDRLTNVSIHLTLETEIFSYLTNNFTIVYQRVYH